MLNQLTLLMLISTGCEATTIIKVRYRGGIVVCADKQSTDDKTKEVFEVHDQVLALSPHSLIAIAGLVRLGDEIRNGGDTIQVVRYDVHDTVRQIVLANARLGPDDLSGLILAGLVREMQAYLKSLSPGEEKPRDNARVDVHLVFFKEDGTPMFWAFGFKFINGDLAYGRVLENWSPGATSEPIVIGSGGDIHQDIKKNQDLKYAALKKTRLFRRLVLAPANSDAVTASEARQFAEWYISHIAKYDRFTGASAKCVAITPKLSNLLSAPK